MHPEKTERLFQEFPDLFSKEQLIQGFECQDGWFNLLHTLSCRIREYRSQCPENEQFKVVQVKQKMGGLSFYMEGADDFIKKLVQEAEEESRSICELDGEPAAGLFVCAPYWFRYLCATCSELHGYMTIEDYLREKAIEAPVHEQIQQTV